MNILILANKPPYPAKDGSSLATLNMAIGLAQSGHSVKIISISTQKHPCKIEEIPIELRFLIEFYIVPINTRINPFSAFFNLLFSSTPYNIERFINKRVNFILTELIRKEKFDIIQIEGLYLFPYIKTIEKLTKTPIVYRSHNVEHEIWDRIVVYEKNWIKATYIKHLSKRIRRMEIEVIKKVPALVSISKRDETWFKNQGFNKSSITIPMGYQMPNLDATNRSNKDICYLGSLDWIPNQKGLTWFLNSVWPIVTENDPTSQLHIAGRNAPNSLIHFIRNKKGVNYHGEVEDSRAFLNQYRIMVVPLHSGSGMRVKIVEGMFLKMAIITTTIGCEGIEVNDMEHILIADTPKEFALAIEKLKNRPELIDIISDKAFTFANENFNTNHLAEKLTSFYKELI